MLFRSGQRERALPLVGVSAAYPEMNRRAERMFTIEDRIIECFMRSENGTAKTANFPTPESREVKAVKAYLDGFAYWDVPREAHAEALNEVAQYDPLEDDVLRRLREGIASGGLYVGLDTPLQPTVGTDPNGTTEPERFGNLITLHRVGVWWMGISVENINRRQHDVRRLLTRLGLKGVRVFADGQQHRAWVVVDPRDRQWLDTPRLVNSGQWNLIPE